MDLKKAFTAPNPVQFAVHNRHNVYYKQFFNELNKVYPVLPPEALTALDGDITILSGIVAARSEVVSPLTGDVVIDGKGHRLHLVHCPSSEVWQTTIAGGYCAMPESAYLSYSGGYDYNYASPDDRGSLTIDVSTLIPCDRELGVLMVWFPQGGWLRGGSAMYAQVPVRVWRMPSKSNGV